MTDEEAREEVAASLFRVAMSGRSSFPFWRPVAAAAEQLLERPVTPEMERMLRIASAVARRHEDNGGRLTMPDRQWLDHYPNPLRIRLVAQHVQQAADSGTPDPDAIEALGRQYLLTGGDAFPAHFELLGALGRLVAVLGRPREALAMQREAAGALVARGDLAGATFGLSAWLQLSAALADHAEFDRAVRCWDEVSLLGELSESGGDVYVHAAHLRGLVLLGRNDAARSALRSIDTECPLLPTHLSVAVARWRCWLDESAPKSAHDLAGLDAAWRSGNSRRAEAEVERLLGAGAQLYSVLARRAPDAWSGRIPEYLVRFYPY